MKFFIKLSLGVMVIITAALSFFMYYSVTGTFQRELEHQTREALEKHQLVKYALQSNILAACQHEALEDEILRSISEQIKEAFSADFELEKTKEAQDTRYIAYRVEEEGEGHIIKASSKFTQSGYSFALETRSDISFLFSEAELMQKNCRKVYFTAVFISALLTFALAWALTDPIKKLSRASRDYASGSYSVRLEPRSNDEIGELTESFNAMADSIQEKISALELSVKQKEDFTANFAHELKTPMTSIIGYADVLYQKTLPPEQIQTAAGYILNEGLQVEALSFKLMELITLEKKDFLLEEADMKSFFDDIFSTERPHAVKRGVSLSVDADRAYVKVEYDLFKTMILNLIDNALKSGADTVRVEGKAEGDGYIVRVSDNGRGIPQGELDRITEAFYMVDKSRSRKEHGAGLGLALCRKIADIHRTKLCFSSTEGVGTEVRLVMPKSRGEDEE